MSQRHYPLFSKPAEWLALPLIGLSLLGPAFAESTPVQRADSPAGDSASIGPGSANDLPRMLPFLVKSPDRKRLAAELLDAIQQGDLGAAESRLNAAIETGTLAIALVDRLSDPDLLASLQSLNLESARRSIASSSECSASATTVAVNLNLAEMQEALDHEQAYSSMVTRTLTNLMEQYNGLTARLETETSDTPHKVSELQNALQEERQQREAIVREFAKLQTDYQSLQAAEEASKTPDPPDVANLEALLQRERGRGDDAERQLANAREEARNLQASKETEFKDREAAAATRIAELEEAVSQARARSDDFAQKLAAATEALHAIEEANKQKPIRPISEAVPARTETFTALQQENAPAPATSTLPSGEIRAAPREDASLQDGAASVLAVKEGAPVEVAQLPEEALPRSASIAPVPEAQLSPPPQAIKPDDRLTNRAEELFHRGDVSGARLLLERSVKSGNARAAFLLAETFDPHVLSKLGVQGLRGDVDKARELYARAKALGMSQASERLDALK